MTKFLVLAFILISVGCGDNLPNQVIDDEGTPGEDTNTPPTDEGNPQDTNEPAVCLPPTGTKGAATVDAGTPVNLSLIETTSQNTPDGNMNPMWSQDINTLARGTGDCQTVGVLWVDPKGGETGIAKMYYQDVSNVMGAAPSAQPEVVIDGLSPEQNNASLFYAAACMAIVMRPSSTGYMEYDRSVEGIWSGKMVKVAGNSLVTQLSTIAAWQEFDGTMMMIARANVDGVPKGLVGMRTIEAYSEWTFNQFDLPDFTDLFAVRAGADGTIHALYSKTEYPCDPCDMDLYYARLPMDGEWAEEVVQDSKWGSPNDEYAMDPSMALDSDGNPIVVATYLVRVITGSIKSASLRMYGRGPDGWCMEEVADTVDGYQGEDGDDMTGISPYVALDQAGRPHVVFQDKSQWHDGNNYANAVDGQVRYGVRNGKQWTFKTLLTQEGQTESAKPLFGTISPSVVVSPDGTSIHAGTVTYEWDTDSIYFMEMPAADITFRATVIQATSTLP